MLGALSRAITAIRVCVGEDGETIRPTLSYLAANGIGGILDYAAESDVDAEVRYACMMCPGLKRIDLHATPTGDALMLKPCHASPPTSPSPQ